MIKARIFGGLGNQLFIYYSAKSLSIKNNCKLVIDHKSGYKKDKFNRKFLLNELISIGKEEYISNKSIILKKKYLFIRNLNKFINFFLPINYKYYFKDYNKFHKNFKKLKGEVYLDSYLQFYSYFNDIKKLINDDFSKKNIKNINNYTNENFLNNDVAICFRSFNELSNHHSNKIEWNYYHKCLEKLISRHEKVNLHIYTDSQNFVEKYYPEIKHYNSTFNDNYNNPLKTLIKLSMYKNIILSKSTFHWWAAYINDEEKIIYAPSRKNNNEFYPKYWNII